jgi:hypothetical protein
MMLRSVDDKREGTRQYNYDLFEPCTNDNDYRKSEFHRPGGLVV